MNLLRIYTAALRILAVSLSVCYAMPSQAGLSKERTMELTDSLRTELSAKTSAADSLDILYDIFDLAQNDTRTQTATELLETAMRTGNQKAKLDVIRRVSMVFASYAPEKMPDLLNLVGTMPETDEQRATASFVRLAAIGNDMIAKTEEERQEFVHNYLRSRNSSTSDDPYKLLEGQFFMCRYLQTSIPPVVLKKNIDELERMLKALPIRLDALYNTFYLQTAVIYTAAGERELAVHADSCLLRIVDNLKAKAAAEGRKYRDYERYYYQIYRRMLNNFKALTDEEVETLYSKILELVDSNVDIAADFDRNRRPQVYYHMARKEYAQALEHLKVAIDMPANKRFEYQLYPLLLEAARHTGDTQTQLKAAMKYLEILETTLAERNQERKRELELHEEIDAAHNVQTQLAEQAKENEIKLHKRILIAAIVIMVILLILLMVVFLLYRRSRQLAKKAAQSNDELITERDNLRRMQKELIEARDRARKADRHKMQFINNMSHEVLTPLNAIVECSHIIIDNIDENKRKYLDRFANTINISAEMLHMLVSEVLDLAALDNKQVLTKKSNLSVNTLCSIAVDSSRKYVAPGVDLIFEQAGQPDETIHSDAARIEQVLINLLQNAAKFTEKGSIRISYKIDRLASTISFAVADTGIGIPKGKEQTIFERFVKLSNTYSGTGLGLNICRMTAELLGGTIEVDTTYSGPGAKFVFTIPID